MRTERVAFAVCGSFCTHAKALNALSRLAEEYEMLIPIASENAAFTDTRFGAADALLEQMEAITGREVLYDIPSVEPLGPKGLADVLVIAPATGNTIGKLANGIADTAVTMAAKSLLRNGRPVVLAVSTRTSGNCWPGRTTSLSPSVRTTRRRSPPHWWRTSPGSTKPWTRPCREDRFSRC